MLALAAGLDRWPALAVGPDAIERAGDDACGRRLADAADAGEDEGMGDAAGGDRVGERPDHRLLADELRKYRPTTFAELIGQEAMVRTLANAIAAGLAHVPCLS